MATREEMAEAVYLQYPRKRAKKAAIKAIIKAAMSLRDQCPTERQAFAVLWRATRNYAKSDEVKSRDVRFIPYPATWFNSGDWESDEFDGPPKPPTSPEPPKPMFGAWGVTE